MTDQSRFTPSPTDRCSEHGARRLATGIRVYWADQGYDVVPEVRRATGHRTPVWAVVMPAFDEKGGPLCEPANRSKQDG